MSAAIRIEDLFYIYESAGEQVVALRGLHLEVKQGECLVIRGPNGSGKSTLVKLLTGYLKATAGKVFIGNQEIGDIDPVQLRREFVASIDQRGNLIGELTIRENLALGHRLHGATSQESDSLTSSTLEEHGLLSLADSYPHQLSSGQRQLISLIAALATKPKILIADEPSAELDDASAKIVFSLIREAAGSTTVLLVTHDYRAEQYADRIVRIKEGRISEEWMPGQAEERVVDPFGWMRVKEIADQIPSRSQGARDASTTPLLIVDEVSLSYGDRSIFANISFAARPGELITIDSSQAAGSGKSSLLRIMAGIQNPSSGLVLVNGENLVGLSRSDRAWLRATSIGYLSQRSSALENISLADYLGEAAVADEKRFATRSHDALSTLSGGERALFEFLKVLTEKRAILILDEPTSQMDDRRTYEVISKIYKYVKDGGIVVTSTRDRHLLESADQVISLS